MKSQALGSVLLLVTLSWQLGLSQDNKAAESDSCRRINNVRLVARKDNTDDGTPSVKVQVCSTDLTWTYICDVNGQVTFNNITQVCKHQLGDIVRVTREKIVCNIANLSAEIPECLTNRDCNLRCFGSNPTMTPIPAKSTTVFIKPTERDITTETVEVSVPTNSSTIMRNHTERNLAVITGGTLGGLILVMIVVILIIVVVLYKAKHKRENLTWESPNMVGISDRDNDSLTERYQLSRNYEAPQPADYEVFQPSSVSTVASNMPLLDRDPQPYEVLEGYTQQATGDSQDTNRVYETVNNIISTQENERNSSADGHIYFTLEPRDNVK